MLADVKTGMSAASLADVVGAERLADVGVQVDLHAPNVSRTAV